MEEAKDDAVREWAGPWLGHWPSGEGRSTRRTNLQPLFDSEDAAPGSAEASSSQSAPHGTNGETEVSLEQAMAQIAQLRGAVAELKARTPTITSLERMVEQAVRSSNRPARSAPEQSPFHLLFFPCADGYRIEPRDGPPPAVGSTVEVDGARFDVTREGPSPLPGDDRRCAYMLAR